jgi:hypothetical protein
MADDIPIEIRARVEANALFIAIQAGDYARAARAQERLRNLGWILARAPDAKGHKAAPSEKTTTTGT